MNAEEYSERTIELNGWQCRLTTYRVGDDYYCKADNVSPGAALTRATGATKEEAEQKAIKRAAELLGRTRRMAV
jgi:hypothetical protein